MQHRHLMARTQSGTSCVYCSQVMAAGTKELKARIESVKNTQKITDAMKLVAAAKVRRAQDAVINGRPFAENLVKVCVTCCRTLLFMSFGSSCATT